MVAISVANVMALTPQPAPEGFRLSGASSGCGERDTRALFCSTETPGKWEYDVMSPEVSVTVSPAERPGFRHVEFAVARAGLDALEGSFDVAVDPELLDSARWFPRGNVCGVSGRIQGSLAGRFDVQSTEELWVLNCPEHTSINITGSGDEEFPLLAIKITGGLDHPALRPGFQGVFHRGVPHPENGISISAIPRLREGTSFRSFGEAARVAVQVERDPVTTEWAVFLQPVWEVGGGSNPPREYSAFVELRFDALGAPTPPQPR